MGTCYVVTMTRSHARWFWTKWDYKDIRYVDNIFMISSPDHAVNLGVAHDLHSEFHGCKKKNPFLKVVSFPLFLSLYFYAYLISSNKTVKFLKFKWGLGNSKYEWFTYLTLQIGKTKVFLRAGQMAELDARRTEVLGNAAKIIQRQIRTYIARKEFISLRKAAIQLQSCWRGIICNS